LSDHSYLAVPELFNGFEDSFGVNKEIRSKQLLLQIAVNNNRKGKHIAPAARIFLLLNI
jgi:hypothetical protein